MAAPGPLRAAPRARLALWPPSMLVWPGAPPDSSILQQMSLSVLLYDETSTRLQHPAWLFAKAAQSAEHRQDVPAWGRRFALC